LGFGSWIPEVTPGGYLYGGSDLWFGYRDYGLMLDEEFSYCLRELCALGGPIIHAVALNIDAGGVGAGIVGAHYFDRAAVTSAVLFDNNDAIMGLLTGANARQTNHQHRVDPLKNLNVFRGLPVASWVALDALIDVADGRKKSEHLSIANFGVFRNGRTPFLRRFRCKKTLPCRRKTKRRGRLKHIIGADSLWRELERANRRSF
jgi:hypothetical protein